MFEQLHGVCVYRLYLQLCILVGLPATQLGIFGKIARPLLGEMGNGWEIDEFLVFYYFPPSFFHLERLQDL